MREATVTLEDPAYQKLCGVAKQEDRDPEGQARRFVLEALQLRPLAPAKVVANPMARPTSNHASGVAS